MRAKRFLMLCTLVASWNCGGNPEILVNIDGAPAGVERIRVRPSLDGKIDTDIYLNKAQTRFTVQLPAGSQGTVQLDAVALDAVDCKLATGSLSEPVPSNLSRFVERTLELVQLPSPMCMFVAAPNIPVGQGPQSVAVGDFNGDMKPDLAVANANVNAGKYYVSVLLNRGLGDFSQAINLPVTSVPQAVVVGNFNVNDDMNLDLAVANTGSSVISVLLGNGNGGFGPQAGFNVGSAPTAIAVGDFDEDMKLDLAVTNSVNFTVSVLLGTGKGTGNDGFSSATNFNTGNTPNSVAVGYFNNDRNLDLAVVGPDVSKSVSVLLGDGRGGFSPVPNFPAGTESRSVAVGDFNGDLKPDLAVANSGSNDVSVLLGDGQGSFGVATPFAAGMQPASVAVGDFNADMKLDLAVANSGSNSVSVLLGDGKGGFGRAKHFPVGTGPKSVAVGDFNGDMKPDLAVANSGSNDVSVLLNQF